MYAIIKTGGRQFKVSKGDVVRVPSLAGEVGGNFDFSQVLHVAGEDKHLPGLPTVANALVKATIVRQGRDRKILVYKYKRRKGYEKMRGHRQGFTEVKIEDIVTG